MYFYILILSYHFIFTFQELVSYEKGVQVETLQDVVAPGKLHVVRCNLFV